MPSKDTFTIAPAAASMITALTALIGSGASVDAGFAFKKSATTQTTAKDITPTVAPTNV